MHISHRGILVVCFVLLFAGASALAQGVVENKRYGFKLRPPAGWKEVPLKVDERWIVAKFLSDKEYYDAEADKGAKGWNTTIGGFMHRPSMSVIVFPEDQTKPRKPKKIDTGSTGEEKKVSVVLKFEHPYKDYVDYLDRNYRGGGFYVADEKQGEVDGTPVTMREINVEKLTRQKKKLIAWQYELEGLDVVVEFEILLGHADKLKQMLTQCLRSFRPIERVGVTDAEREMEERGREMRETEFSRLLITEVEGENLSAAERKKRRLDLQEHLHKTALARLPAGWTSKRTPHFLVLSHVDDRFRDKVVAQAETVRKWLDRNFDDIGDDYVPHGIIRICASRDEERAYHRASGDAQGAFSFESGEVTISKDYTFKKWEFEWLNRGLALQWFFGKNSRLAWSLPPWLQIGLSEYLGSASEKGGKLNFPADEWEKRGLREAERSNELLSLKDLMDATDAAAWSYRQHYQAASVVRYLLGQGGKTGKSKDFIKRYLKTWDAVVREMAKEEAAKSKEKGRPKTEEEEEEELKRQRGAWGQNTKAIQDKVHPRVFAGWTDADWAALERAWRAAAL
jgi:hypothetical protein